MTADTKTAALLAGRQLLLDGATVAELTAQRVGDAVGKSMGAVTNHWGSIIDYRRTVLACVCGELWMEIAARISGRGLQAALEEGLLYNPTARVLMAFLSQASPGGDYHGEFAGFMTKLERLLAEYDASPETEAAQLWGGLIKRYVVG
jgi:AcrR family transcriptional regulator